MQTYVSAVLDSGFEIGRPQIPKSFVMLPRSGQVDGQTFNLDDGATSASLAQKLRSVEKITFDQLAADSLVAVYRKAGRNRQYTVISIHLPDALYGGVRTAKFVRNLLYDDKIHIFEMLTTSEAAVHQLVGFVDRAIKYNWSPLPIIKVADYLCRKMRSVYVVPADSPPVHQSSLFNRLTAQRGFVTFTIGLDGNIQILERGSAEKLLPRAPQWLQKITSINNLKDGITQTRSHSLDAFQNHLPPHNTTAWSPLTIGGLGNTYLEMSWRPSPEQIKQLVKLADKQYGQVATFSKPLYEYTVKL